MRLWHSYTLPIESQRLDEYVNGTLAIPAGMGVSDIFQTEASCQITVNYFYEALAVKMRPAKDISQLAAKYELLIKFSIQTGFFSLLTPLREDSKVNFPVRCFFLLH